jgi:hypothetical protein
MEFSLHQFLLPVQNTPIDFVAYNVGVVGGEASNRFNVSFGKGA